jgi:hypothetical protein
MRGSVLPGPSGPGPTGGGPFGTVRPPRRDGTVPSSMYLRTYVDLPLDFDQVRAALLLGRPPSCLDGAAEAAAAECRELMRRAGLTSNGHVAAWPTFVEAEPAITSDHLASVPLNLYAGDSLMTRLATLDAGWLGTGRTHLSLSLSYDALVDAARGRPRNRALLHRVHEAVALRFLGTIAAHIVRQATSLDPASIPAS